ncbi:MAG TPA: hemerythrin family protein [Bryobacteraceae bacterium]|nr:hemerythrin family protein [Bryobacteraceae bacterium]
MQALNWTADISVFDPAMDEEHQLLFRLLEKLRRDLWQREPAALHRDLRDFSNHLGRHFLEEERLMRQSRYSGIHWHTSQHQTGRTKFAALDQAARGNGPDSVFACMEALAAWLTDHIVIADRMFSAHLRNYQRSGPLAMRTH